jgi:nickel transport protein
MKKVFALVAVLAASLGAAQAHDVWITIDGPSGERRAIVNYGHPQDRPPALADKIVGFTAFTGKERLSLAEGLAHTHAGSAIVVASKTFDDAGHALVAASYDNGYWVKAPSGAYYNATRRSVPDAVDSLWSGKFAKAVTGTGSPWATAIGTPLELVPLADPAAQKPGDSLPVRVLFKGQPLAEVAVERTDGVTLIKEEDIPKFTTDKDGVAQIPLANAGLHLLAVDYKVSPSETPALAQTDLYNATLSFVVSEKP